MAWVLKSEDGWYLRRVNGPGEMKRFLVEDIDQATVWCRSSDAKAARVAAGPKYKKLEPVEVTIREVGECGVV